MARKTISYNLLKLQNVKTSTSIISFFKTNTTFMKASKIQTDMILTRDKQDEIQLKKGIQYAASRGVIPSTVEVEDTVKIDVIGKTVEETVREITDYMNKEKQKRKVKQQKQEEEGSIIVLQGLSGTGKGSTVAVLKDILPNTVTWSNGNIFRVFTLLAVTYSKQNNISLEESLSDELLKKYANFIFFDKYNGKFDVCIRGLGFNNTLVSDIQNTLLKSVSVTRNVPEVASVTQGEVINFTKKAVKLMSTNGANVILEGRSQTLDYIRTPLRFELVLSDDLLIGRRRTAQVIMADTLMRIKDKYNNNNNNNNKNNNNDIADDEVVDSLNISLQNMYKSLL